MPEPVDRRRVAITLAVVALVGGVAAWVYWGAEWVVREVDRGYGEDALRNRYLAAELFLEIRGVDAETVTGLSLLDDLPDQNDLLILSSSRRTLSERRQRALEDWVHSGGHLMVVATELWDDEAEQSRDRLLDALGIRLYELWDETDEESLEEEGADEEATVEPEEKIADVLDETEAEEDSEAPPPEEVSFGDLISFTMEPYECSEDENEIATVGYADTGHTLKLELAREMHLEAVDGLRFAIDSPEASQVVQAEIGDGLVTATTSLTPWQNTRIHCHDHAFLLWLLASDADKVWMLHDPDLPSFAAIVWGAFPLSCLAAMTLLVLWAASRTLRFGVPPARVEPERRELIEHLEAAAGFQWRSERLGPLIEEMRKAIRRKRRELAAELPYRVVGVSRADLDAALRGPLPAKRNELIRMLKALQKIGSQS